MTPTIIEEEDWLLGYLATTKYASDPKITANPVKPKASTVHKKKYSLQASTVTKNMRRRSWTSSDRPVVAQPSVSRLPDRVNAVRENGTAYAKPVDGHFVREHKMSRLEDKPRRQTLDYDELEAVKERVMQAANMWKKSNFVA